MPLAPISAPLVASDKPLPEPSMFWRRLLTFLITISLVALLWAVSVAMPTTDLLKFCHLILIMLIVTWGFYFAGATASDLTQILANLHFQIHAPRDVPTFRPADSTAIVTPAVVPATTPAATAVVSAPAEAPVPPVKPSGGNPLAGTPFDEH